MLKIDMEMPQSCMCCRFYYMSNEKNEELNEKNEDKIISFRCLGDMNLRRKTLKEICCERTEDCPLKESKQW